MIIDEIGTYVKRERLALLINLRIFWYNVLQITGGRTHVISLRIFQSRDKKRHPDK